MAAGTASGGLPLSLVPVRRAAHIGSTPYPFGESLREMVTRYNSTVPGFLVLQFPAYYGWCDIGHPLVQAARSAIK